MAAVEFPVGALGTAVGVGPWFRDLIAAAALDVGALLPD
jgi:hypothetical protein